MRQKIQASAVFSTQGDRPIQEDSVLMDKEKGVFVVSDGFGGPNSGPDASKIACESIKKYLFKKAGDQDATMPFILRQYFSLAGNVLFNAVMFANQQIRKLNKTKNVNECGGASVLVALLDEDLLAIASVGCCDAWLLRDNKLVELVKPRTFGSLCDPFNPKARHYLQVPMMALGMADDLEPEIFEFKVRKGDLVILNTDGLTEDGIKDIQRIFAQTSQSGTAPDSPASIVSRLTHAGEMIERLKTRDNCAISLIKF